MSDATKACPFCGEQILAVAIKCKHCGSALGGPANGAASAVKRQFRLRPKYLVLGLVVVAVFGGNWLYNWTQTGSIVGNGFSDADIADAKESIRTEFAKQRGVTVQEVQLLRESPRKLNGFVRIKVPLLGAVTKSCTATMGDGRRYLWQCE